MTALFKQRPPISSRPVSPQNRQLGFLWEFSLVTSVVAISAGIGFGCSVRLNRPQEPGATVLHSEQSFPPRQDWPLNSEQCSVNSVHCLGFREKTDN